jgi:fermentation-respiration switch protein FrsA (DUF1100 family)
VPPRPTPTTSKAERILAAVRAARDVPTGVRFDLEISDGAARVPAILLVPHSPEPVPAALLLHGFGSRKELMADTIGEALMGRGIISLSVDLPLQGERKGSPQDFKSSNPTDMIGCWTDALAEARLALDYLESHERVDARRLAIVGYSLGSFLGNIVAAAVPNVRAIVLAASGDLPEGLPYESLMRAMIDPLRAVRCIAGRPLLMVSGRFDRTVRPSQAERLFAAAYEPKTMRWHGEGHWPPQREIEYAAGWLAGQLAVTGEGSPQRLDRQFV